MARLDPADLERLRMIAQAGGELHIVTVRARVRDPLATGLQRWAEAMCDADYMRLTLKRGDPYDPNGEQFFDYVLTAKAKGAVTRSQGPNSSPKDSPTS